ncbi:MAG: HigA family addiction module antidote protein [Alphaproteobacteria bacterium]|nr:HigA family addiction module antidote protein [Alphaproteobacteria bacterium]
MAKKQPPLLDPIHPGEILLEEFLRPLAISINRLAGDLDVPISRISNIVNGKRGITADTAMRLGKYFTNTPEFWLNLQTHYELEVMRQDTWPAVESRIREAALQN